MDVVARYNLLLRALSGDEGAAPSRMRAVVAVDGAPCRWARRPPMSP